MDQLIINRNRSHKNAIIRHREKAEQYELRASLARKACAGLRQGSYALEVSERLADNYDRMAATERHKVRELEEGDG